MRRTLEDWERAEDLATPYTRAQVEQFSPKSRAILEIQSRRDLEILEKIYANAVLLGDDGPDGWGIRYAREFDMTNDSKLFPPRPKWEAKGYRPDEYSRWLKGDWRPIEELWAELGVDPDKPVPAEIELEDWLFDTSAGPERREAEARFMHGHVLKPGDVARTDWAVRCAQPPYDRLPVPRVEIPPGMVLSREGDAWIRESRIDDIALPLYEGRMIGQFDISDKGWVSGKGRGAVWRDIPWERKQIEPQYLIGSVDFHDRIQFPWRPKVTHMSVGSATNTRTAIGTLVCGVPGSHKAPMLYTTSVSRALALTVIYNSLVYDYVMRARVVGLGIDYHVLEQTPLPPLNEVISSMANYSRLAEGLCLTAHQLSPAILELLGGMGDQGGIGTLSAITVSERTRVRAILDAIVVVLFGLNYSDLHRILDSCDLPTDAIVGTSLDPKGFWRLDRGQEPELRQTVLALVALRDLEAKIHAASDNRDDGVRAFFAQNEGEGWLLPEMIRLAEHGIGHDDRAMKLQVLAGRLSPRFYDWHLAQTGEESMRECHLHARNMLGAPDYARLLDRVNRQQVRAGEGSDGVLPGDLAREFIRHEKVSAGTDGIALRGTEAKPGYSSAPSDHPRQTEMFPRPQPEMFE